MAGEIKLPSQCRRFRVGWRVSPSVPGRLYDSARTIEIMCDHEAESSDNENRDLLAGFGSMSDVPEFRAIVEATGKKLDRELRNRSDHES